VSRVFGDVDVGIDRQLVMRAPALISRGHALEA
jgi:hypothetical protein